MESYYLKKQTLSVMVFETADKAFKAYYDFIKDLGDDRGDNLCLFNVFFEIEFPTQNIITARSWSQHYAEREWNWYLTGSRSVSSIKRFAPMWDKMHNGNDLVWSNYGYWWKQGDQLVRVIEMLKDDETTRRAVIVHYSAETSPEFTHDTPCNLVLNFFVVGTRLNLTIMARSIDIWYGFCNDQYVFSKLLQLVADRTQKQVGTMSYFITNFHLYKNQIK